MIDLIDRKAAIDALRREYNTEDSDFPTEYQLGLSAGRRIIDELPSAQFIEPEQETGKWVEIHGYCTPGGDPVWQCSECGKGIHTYGIEHGTYGADISDGQWKACPNCGATMEKTE